MAAKEAREEEVDILIIGSGSAGLAALTWFARCNLNDFPRRNGQGLRIKIVESMAGPLERGKADGVQCRTVEVYESFGLAEDILREGYHVLENCFWSSTDVEGDGGVDEVGRGLHRTKVSPDTAPGLSHQPHLILNQARMNGVLLEAVRRWSGMEVDYDVVVKHVGVEEGESSVQDEDAYPIRVVTERGGQEVVYRARYALGCDGAHSVTRKSLGYKMVGDSSDATWGVMDIYPQTNFPDIRKKVVLQTDHGNLLIIPREGGALVRFYLQLPHGTKAKEVTLEDLQATAKRIFHPYKMEFADTFWWSAYPIGQRVADHFSKDNRIFLTGDACHTHSPKAGQGMNTSLQDGYNIGWKLVSILKKQAPPSLLTTYNLEREKVAKTLIDFDRELTTIWARNNSNGKTADGKDVLVEHFLKSARYTAGLTARYDESVITWHERSKQGYAAKLEVGMRFPSTTVVRFCDAKSMHFVQALAADGRWRVVFFAGEIGAEDLEKRLQKISDFVEAHKGPINRFTPPGADVDSLIEILVVLKGDRRNIELEQIPSNLWPETGRYKQRDVHKIFVDDEAWDLTRGHAYETYGVDAKVGATVIVRPDQYVSYVGPLEDLEVIGEFFDGFMLLPQNVE